MRPDDPAEFTINGRTFCCDIDQPGDGSFAVLVPDKDGERPREFTLDVFDDSDDERFLLPLLGKRVSVTLTTVTGTIFAYHGTALTHRSVAS